MIYIRRHSGLRGRRAVYLSSFVFLWCSQSGQRTSSPRYTGSPRHEHKQQQTGQSCAARQSITTPRLSRFASASPFRSKRLADATRTLLHQPGIREGLILSTCNRVELLTFQDEIADASNTQSKDKTDLLRFLHEYFAVPPSDIQPHLYEFREREAVRHLFRVASSLDSMVVGEPQILGQVKEAYTIARDAGAVSTHLEALLQRTFTVAKKIRTETQIGSSSVSIASVADDLARRSSARCKEKLSSL